jgi:hypothetical protein
MTGSLGTGYDTSGGSSWIDPKRWPPHSLSILRYVSGAAQSAGWLSVPNKNHRIRHIHYKPTGVIKSLFARMIEAQGVRFPRAVQQLPVLIYRWRTYERSFITIARYNNLEIPPELHDRPRKQLIGASG